MKRLAVWVGVLTIFTGAYAQTQDVIESQLVNVSSEALEAYIAVSDLNYKATFTTAECNAVRNNVIKAGDSSKAFIEKTATLTKNNPSNINLDIRSSAAKVFSAVVSTLSAVNSLCVGGNKDIIDLNLQIASLKFDISTLYRSKSVR